jgi:uncharacterized membrane protein
MISWYGYSIAALMLLGTQRFLYKVTAQKGLSSGLTTTVFMATVTVLSALLYVQTAPTPPPWFPLLPLALANSLSFALSTIANIEALRYLSAGIIFPLTRLSLATVVVISVVYFNEALHSPQMIGVVLAFGVVYLLAGEARQDARNTRDLRRGLLFIGLCILCGTIASVSSKMAAVGTDKAAFMTLSYLIGTLFCLIMARLNPRKIAREHRPAAIGLGIAMGVLNFGGFYAFLQALSVGPLSAIIMITGMHFVIALALSVIIYHEPVTRRRSLALLLTVIAVVLLKT